MIYTVVWLPDALDDLAAVWMQPTARKAVTAAAHRIDRTLRRDPDTKGQDYFGDRVLFEHPLAVTFAVYPDDRLVKVLQVAFDPN